jgi:tetratricopeptide (TPR) repeat protein
VIELEPNDERAYNNRGIAYVGLQKYEKAIVDYNKAIELDPHYATAYNNRGIAYGKLQKYKDAIVDYNNAIELNPSYANAYNNRGNAYIRLQQHENAISDFNRVIELAPDHATAYINRGTVYCKLRQIENAIVDFNKAIELNPNNADSYLSLSESLIIKGEYKRSLEIATKALGLSLEVNDEVIGKYLECISRTLLDLEVSECTAELAELISQDIAITWSFDEIESWLKEADISDDKKAFIIRLTEQIEKHKTQ